MEPITCPHSTCGHTWTPRKASPKKCPQCQNPLWRSPRPKKQRQEKVLVSRGWNGSPFEDGEAVFILPETAKPEPECMHAPENDSLSEMRSKAEALLRQLV